MSTFEQEAKDLFNKVYELPSTLVVPFNPKWSNGTGYFDHAVEGDEAPVLTSGRIVKSSTPTGRKIMIIGTLVGNVVVFQRYDDRDDVFVINTSTIVGQMGWFDGKRLNYTEMTIALGQYGDGLENIGHLIKRLHEACKKSKSKAEKP